MSVKKLGLMILTVLILSACSHRSENSYRDGVYQSSDLDPVHAFKTSSLVARGAAVGVAGGAAAGAATGGSSLIPMALGGAILGAGVGAVLENESDSKNKLENRGVQMVRVGDDLLFILPSDILFAQNTSTLNSNALPLLEKIANYIAHLSNVGVRVVAYRNASISQKAALALSQLQAQTVAKFLWAHGIDTRLLYSSGQGASHFVEPINPDLPSNLNNRVEITLQTLPNI